MNRYHITTTLRRLTLALTAAVAGLSLSSCNDLIYDYEGDCDPHYKARFIFDHNLKYADAFANEVNAVTLYITDPATGRIVWQKSESGDALRTGDYLMDIDGIAPGDYNLMAWCGEGVGEHFAVPEADVHTGLTCTLRRDEDTPEIRHRLKNLYYGKLTARTFPDDEGTYIFNVPLIKNTNEVNIVLQHLSGEPVDKDDFIFSVVDGNSHMDWDNSLLEVPDTRYYAYRTMSGNAGIDYPEAEQTSRATTNMSACVANITTGRLTTEHSNRMMVQVHKKDGSLVLSIPLIQYALLVKGSHYEMPDQEYLDRQDKYDLVFFLDEGNRWIDTYIYINSWKLVLQSIEI